MGQDLAQGAREVKLFSYCQKKFWNGRKKTFTVLIRSPSQRHNKQSGRFSEQAEGSGGRVEPEFRSFCIDHQDLGPPTSGPVCIEAKHTAPAILFPSQRRQFSGNRRFGAPLEFSPGVCLSPIPVDSTGIEENTERKSIDISDYSILAKESLVFHRSANGNQTILAASSQTGFT